MGGKVVGWGHFLFGLRAPVSRRDYALVGFGLMGFKYLVDAIAVRAVTGESWTLVDYFAPTYLTRGTKLAAAPTWFPVVLALWTLPFAWIGVSMTVRRAEDAGLTGWFGLVFFLPLLNYLLMLVLCVLSPHEQRAPRARAVGGERAPIADSLRSALFAVAAGAVVVVGMVLFTVTLSERYGRVLFLGVPFLLGAAGAFLHNRPEPRSLRQTLLVALVSTTIAAGMLLLFALEGAVCVLMALPLALPLAMAGALLGWSLTNRARPRPGGLTLGIAVLPLLALAEGRWGASESFEVVTRLEIAAPPEAVWPNVVRFSELPPPERWLFRTGIAYPVRARIDGTGVGALRRCEFSTGAFVEPITRWEEPHRLSFDVVAQPDPMAEWSFYDQLRPPHLHDAFRSERGEFRLVPLEGGRTLLEGSTWYVLDVHPTWYWRAVSEPVLHAIHTRVLEHVARLSES